MLFVLCSIVLALRCQYVQENAKFVFIPWWPFWIDIVRKIADIILYICQTDLRQWQQADINQQQKSCF